MRVGLIEAVWDGSGNEGLRGVELAKEIGYESVDLVTDPLDLTDDQLDAAVQAALASPLPVAAGICVSLGITDFNPSVRRFHTDRAKRHVDFAARVGASNMLMVIGEYVWKKEVIPPREQWDWAVANLREIALHAESLGLEIALELEPYEWAYVNSVDEMVRLLDDVDVPAMKANADLAHLWPMKIDAGRAREAERPNRPRPHLRLRRLGLPQLSARPKDSTAGRLHGRPGRHRLRRDDCGRARAGPRRRGANGVGARGI